MNLRGWTKMACSTILIFLNGNCGKNGWPRHGGNDLGDRKHSSNLLLGQACEAVVSCNPHSQPSRELTVHALLPNKQQTNCVYPHPWCSEGREEHMIQMLICSTLYMFFCTIFFLYRSQRRLFQICFNALICSRSIKTMNHRISKCRLLCSRKT